MAKTKTAKPNKPYTADFQLTVKNAANAASKKLSQNEIVWQLAPVMKNQELVELLTKLKIKFTINSLRWYASKSRAGIRR